MALLDLPASASLRQPAAEVGQGPVPPQLRSVLRRVGMNLLVACVIPGIVFYTMFMTFGVWPAIVASLTWSYGAIAIRALTGRRPSGMLLLTAGVLTLRTIVALASHSTFIYFLQPVLTDLLIGTAFLASTLTARPVVARLAGDFYPITDELHARPAMRRLFHRLTLLWAAALLAKAVVVYMLLLSQPLATFVLAKSILVPITNASCIALTVIAATAVARREGLLPGAPRNTPGMALHDFPRHQLTFGPSPVHPLPRLSAHLGGAQVWAKREDCNSGLAYGGNKTRKLEYLVPEALAQGADTLVSIGGHQSNHTRQVAAVAAHLGLQCVLVQENWVPEWTDPLSTQVGNILLSRIMGADVRLDPAGFDIGFRDSWRQALEDVEKRGGTPYAIPAGASDHRLGGLGFAGWAYEVAEQEAELGVFFDTVVVCTVTGSTHAGMIAGFAALEEAGGRPRRVLGIDASATLEKTRDQVGRIARNTAELIGVGRDLRDDEITVLEGWAGDVYGVPVQSTLDAIRLTGQLEGVILDTVYEGKSMAGLVDLVRNGDIPKDSTVLYAHLGGQPALNAYAACSRRPSVSRGRAQTFARPYGVRDVRKVCDYPAGGGGGGSAYRAG